MMRASGFGLAMRHLPRPGQQVGFASRARSTDKTSKPLPACQQLLIHKRVVAAGDNESGPTSASTPARDDLKYTDDDMAKAVAEAATSAAASAATSALEGRLKEEQTCGVMKLLCVAVTWAVVFTSIFMAVYGYKM